MKKQEFYQELQNIGVDTSNKEQMRVWSLALLRYGEDYRRHAFHRCDGCHYELPASKSGKFRVEDCPNRYCPVKNLPETPGQIIEMLFDQDYIFDLEFLFKQYVTPILDELVKQEEERNAR